MLGRDFDNLVGRPHEAEPRFFLTKFDKLYAPLVTSWVRSEGELTMLAPGTPPPLSPHKVNSWGGHASHRFLFWGDASADPIGYAELNKMPRQPHRIWIGHFLVSPQFRGRKIGQRFCQGLLARTFNDLAASEALLIVFPDNAAAIRCYESCGLTIESQEKKYFKHSRKEHVFLRMVIHRRRYGLLLESEGLPSDSAPFVDEIALARRVVRTSQVNPA